MHGTCSPLRVLPYFITYADFSLLTHPLSVTLPILCTAFDRLPIHNSGLVHISPSPFLQSPTPSPPPAHLPSYSLHSFFSVSPFVHLVLILICCLRRSRYVLRMLASSALHASTREVRPLIISAVSYRVLSPFSTVFPFPRIRILHLQSRTLVDSSSLYRFFRVHNVGRISLRFVGKNRSCGTGEIKPIGSTRTITDLGCMMLMAPYNQVHVLKS